MLLPPMENFYKLFVKSGIAVVMPRLLVFGSIFEGKED